MRPAPDEPTKIVLADSGDQVLERERSDLATWNARGPSPRHAGTLNVLCLDGSVQRQVPEDINPYTLRSLSTPGVLSNKPAMTLGPALRLDQRQPAQLGELCLRRAAVGEPLPDKRTANLGTIASRNWTVINGLDATPGVPMSGQGQTGTLDDFRVYDRVLSDFEIRQIYDKTKVQ